MGEKLVRFFVLFFLMLVLGNLLLPEFLYERVLAAIFPEFRLKKLFFQIEPGNERELAERLNIYLSNNVVCLDDSNKKLVFEKFIPDKPVFGTKMVKIELLNPLKKSKIPVYLSFFRCENKLIKIYKSFTVQVERSTDNDETARRICKLLAFAFQSFDT